MKNKKGFTLIEIIICISLIVTISTISIVIFTRNKDYSNITKKILEAANVYIATEKDDQGNTYEYGINNGGKGVKINVNELVNKGYVDEKLYKTLEKEYKLKGDESYLVWITNSINKSTDKECGANALEYTVNWEDVKDVIYLCPYNSNGNSNELSANTLIGKIKKDYEENGSTCEKVGFDTGICLLRGKNNTKDNKSVYYYVGSNQKNYLKIGNENFYIVRTMEDGGVKLVTTSTINSNFTLTSGEIANSGEIYVNKSPINFNFDVTEKYGAPSACHLGNTRKCTIINESVVNSKWDDKNEYKVEYQAYSNECSKDRNGNIITPCSKTTIESLPHQIYSLVNNWYNTFENDNKIQSIVLENNWCDNSFISSDNNYKGERHTNCKNTNENMKYKFGLLNLDEYYLVSYADNSSSNGLYNKNGYRSELKLYSQDIDIYHSEFSFDFNKTTYNLHFASSNTATGTHGISKSLIYIRPSIVVKEDLIITNGTGTKDDPFIAQIN